MLKKKNIAMAMAVATVATSVAPAFAAVKEQNVDEATMISKVKEVLDVKYFGSEDKVYTVEIVKPDVTKNVIVKDIKTLESELASARIKDETVKVTIKDNGHIVNNGRIEKTVSAKYELYNNVATSTADLDTLDALFNQIEAFKKDANYAKMVRSVVYYGVDGKELTTPEADTVTDATITLVNGKEIKLAVGDKQLDFGTAIDVNGKEIPVDKITSLETGKQVVGFKTLENPTASTITIPGKVVDSLVYNAKEDTKIEKNLSDLYNANGYTKAGVTLVNKLIEASATTNTDHTTTVISNGKEYTVKFEKADLSTVKVNNAGKYELTANLKVEEGKVIAGKFTDKAKDMKLVITSDSYADLTKVYGDIDGAKTAVEGEGKYKVYAGANRFETAVEISKESFDKYDDTKGTKGTAKSVVLVGEDAIVDGLAAAPLAKQKEAPILLTKKDAISDKTMNEIKRVVDKNSTVYIVGGDSVISKDVEAQLIKEMNAKIVRLAGNSRYETSVKIAENMKKESTSTNMDQAFVVGGFGEADAMSIAAVASNITKSATKQNEIAPIIVSPESGLTQDAKDFLYKSKDQIDNVDVVGGTSKVSNQVMKDIKANVDSAAKVERTAGYNRQETNAQVISKYYAKDAANPTTTGLTGIYVAKDGTARGNGELIDALAVAPLAGRTATPIVLATDKISEEQVDAVEKNAKAVTAPDKHTMIQAGNGVAQTVLDKLVKALSL